MISTIGQHFARRCAACWRTAGRVRDRRILDNRKTERLVLQWSRTLPTDSTPADVVQLVVDALDARRWHAVVPLVDEEDLKRFAADQVSEMRRLETEPSVADQLRGRSGVAPEVVDRIAQSEVERRREGRARLARLYGGRSTSEELAQLAPESLFVLWLAGSDPAEQVRRSVAHLEGVHPGFTRAAQRTTPRLSREIVRTEYEDASRARVRYKEWIGTEAGDAVFHVANLRRTSHGWRIQVDPELMGHASLWVVVEPADD